MAGVFISYRREDSKFASRAIYDELDHRFRWVPVFFDIDEIPPGRDFRQVIQSALEHSSVALAIIGPGWLGSTTPTGARRLDNPADFVRLEIEMALARQIPLFVLLVSGAAPPDPRLLPPSLAPLARCPTLPVRPGASLQGDLAAVREAVLRAAPSVGHWRVQHPRLLTLALVLLVVALLFYVPIVNTFASLTFAPLALILVAYAIIVGSQLRRRRWVVALVVAAGISLTGIPTYITVGADPVALGNPSVVAALGPVGMYLLLTSTIVVVELLTLVGPVILFALRCPAKRARQPAPSAAAPPSLVPAHAPTGMPQRRT